MRGADENILQDWRSFRESVREKVGMAESIRSNAGGYKNDSTDHRSFLKPSTTSTLKDESYALKLAQLRQE